MAESAPPAPLLEPSAALPTTPAADTPPLPGPPPEAERLSLDTETPLPTLEQMQAEVARARAEDRESYARLWVPDADTTDAESNRSRRAQQIVLAAVEAMGGRDALLGIRDLSYGGSFHKAFGPRSRFVRWLPAGARLIYDGDRAFVDAHGFRHELRDEETLRLVRWQAERWDFLSRYLGDGVQLEYLGTIDRMVPRRLRPGFETERMHAIRINDRRHGGLVFHAYFDAQTGLLHHEDYPFPGDETHPPDWLFAGYPWSAKFYWEYRRVRNALLWTEVGAFSYEAMQVRRRDPVDWSEIDASVFAFSSPDTTVVEPTCCESESTLWVHVGLPGAAYVDSVLPGASTSLGYEQRYTVRDDVRRALQAELRRHGVVRQVRITDDDNPVVLPVGDYLLAVILYDVHVPGRGRGVDHEPPRRSAPIYFASLRLGGNGRPIMQDGPSILSFPPNDPACLDYLVHVYSTGVSGAYTRPDELTALARRTALKLTSAVQQYETSGDDHMLYMQKRSFCEEPGAVVDIGRR